MADYNIRITVEDLNNKTDAEKALEVATGNNGTSNITKPAKSTLERDKKSVAAEHILIDRIQTGVSNITAYTLGNVGTFTGNQATQNQINNIVSTASSLVGSISTVASAAAVGGPTGAIVAGIYEVIQNGINILTNEINEVRNKRREAITEVYLSERLGILYSDKNRG